MSLMELAAQTESATPVSTGRRMGSMLAPEVALTRIWQ